MSGVTGLIKQELVPGLGVIAVHFYHRSSPIRLGQLTATCMVSESQVLGLTSELEHLTRDRSGDTFGGQFTHERVASFPGKVACECAAAEQRLTSTSCANSWWRLRNSLFYEDSTEVVHGRLRALIFPLRSQFCLQPLEAPKSSAVCLTVTPASRCWTIARHA